MMRISQKSVIDLKGGMHDGWKGVRRESNCQLSDIVSDSPDESPDGGVLIKRRGFLDAKKASRINQLASLM